MSRATAWAVVGVLGVAVGDGLEPIYVLWAGRPAGAGPIDPACVAPTNEIYQPTPYQASAKSWTPSGEVWGNRSRAGDWLIFRAVSGRKMCLSPARPRGQSP